MTQEDKNLLLKDLCARLPYGIKAQYNSELIGKIKVGGIEGYDNNVFFMDDRYPYYVEELSPYLRPMSSMTEEEQEEFLDLIIPIDRGKAVVEEDNIERYNEFIYAHHFDNKGLIEKGLSLEAPEGMYND